MPRFLNNCPQAGRYRRARGASQGRAAPKVWLALGSRRGLAGTFPLVGSYLALALSLLPTLTLGAQEPAPPSKQAPVPVAKEPASTAAAKKDAAAAAKDSERLQKLKQTQFDRRPSTILRAWSKPAPTDAPLLWLGGFRVVVLAHPLDLEMAALRREVALGRWDNVKAYLAKLPDAERAAGYKHVLQSLAGGGGRPGPMMGPPQMAQFQERSKFLIDDVLGLAAATPSPLDKEALGRLGNLARQAIDGGQVVEHIVARLAAQKVLTQRQAAVVLAGAGQAAYLGAFLPTLEQAVKEQDHEGLNLLTRHYIALYAKEKKAPFLEKAWAATQAVLSTPGAARSTVEEGLQRAVELAPKLKEELGQAWLDASFTCAPQRGMDILATIGSLTANGLASAARDPELRNAALHLQKTALDALLRATPPKAAEWQNTLTLLAGNWLREAEFSQLHDHSAGRNEMMRRDRFGNIFYMNDFMGPPMMQQQQQNMPLPVKVVDLLDCRPTAPWLERINAGVRPQLYWTTARLYLKANEDAQAFPYIEQLAKSHRARRAPWSRSSCASATRTHDLNSDRNPQYYNPYLYFYGFNRQAESIPLTRSKQERNLTELAGWVARLDKLQLGEIDQELLAKAFTTCHSSAEVYKIEAIEKVFGPIAKLKPKTFAALAQQMRENLTGQWRDPAEQKNKKTNRKSKDIQVEVERGYAVARAVVDRGRKQFPDEWSLRLAHAALLHDENNYAQEMAKSTRFSAKRHAALAEFKKAADEYAAKVKDLSEDEETTQVYEQWFYASLGACDIKHITDERQPDLTQPARSCAAIRALSGEAAERHMGKFANNLFTRLSAVAPAVKYRYLRAGLEIAGTHKQARDAVKSFDYYKDLITEIKLDTIVDGSAVVGRAPFGVFVNLRHTREIERESGGFGRYLQNQNSLSFYYNFGRPTADYRDKFTTTVNEALKEHFEVIAVAFQSDKVHSRALPEYGWRYTPYAYLLLKARGPQVDKLPPLRIDLDFIEASGYVIIPVESPALPLDAARLAEARPVRKLQITQILDERQADKGKLLLEVKATGIGLVPSLDRILDLAPPGFTIVKTDDQGVSVAKFDDDGDQNGVVSERTWTIALEAEPGVVPETFRFGTARMDGTEMTYQHYQDADLATATPEIALEQSYGRPDYFWLWAGAGGGVLVAVVLILAVLMLLRKPSRQAAQRWSLPEPLTPFTVLDLLRRMLDSGALTATQRTAIGDAVAAIERRYFAEDGDGAIDLRA